MHEVSPEILEFEALEQELKDQEALEKERKLKEFEEREEKQIFIEQKKRTLVQPKIIISNLMATAIP